MESKAFICDAIDSLSSKLHELSKSLWSHPELAYQEFYAHKILTDLLESEGFNVKREFILKTGFQAVYKTAPRPHIMLICEFDALPDIGHACGHNLIAEVAVGTAIAVKKAMQKFKLQGCLTVLGTPAEERGGGKLKFIEAGIISLDKVDAAMMCHPNRIYYANYRSLAINSLIVKYKGKASHAASAPYEGVNALDAAVLAYSGISCLRQQMKPTWRCHGIITDGGKAPNIIPDQSSLSYFFRAPKQSEVSTLVDKAKECFNAAAQMTGCSVEIINGETNYANMVSNPCLVDLFNKYANALPIEHYNELFEEFTFGSTDMGNVSLTVPSIHPYFYIGTKAPNHSKAYTEATGAAVAQPFTLQQCKVLAQVVVAIFQEPQLCVVMRSQFENYVKNQ